MKEWIASDIFCTDCPDHAFCYANGCLRPLRKFVTELDDGTLIDIWGNEVTSE